MEKKFKTLFVILGIILFAGGIYCWVAGVHNFTPFHTNPINITDYEYEPIDDIPNLMCVSLDIQYERKHAQKSILSDSLKPP